MTTNAQDITNLGEMSPSKYFEILKGRKNKITDEQLSQFYDNAMSLLNKYAVTEQVDAMKKLIFLVETVEKERQLVRLGIDTFVYYEDIEEYIDKIAKNVVKIIELKRYERDIPDEIVEIIEKTKPIFSQFYVVFTDYTGEMNKKIEKERDPILFGTFEDAQTQTLLERFYFLGDWEDEFCDLTLQKMVREIKVAKSKNIIRNISTPTDVAALKQQLADLTQQKENYKMKEKENRIQHFFRKINSFKKGGKQ